jgi:hypothetical protein
MTVFDGRENFDAAVSAVHAVEMKNVDEGEVVAVESSDRRD